MNFKINFNILLGLFLILSSCDKQAKIKKEETDTVGLIEQVKFQVNAFHAADTALNSDKVIDLLWPEFTMLADGNYIEFNDVKTGSKKFMTSLKSFNTQWNDLRIIPLGKNHAISSFIFIDSLVAKDGTITKSKGPNTFIWEKRDGEWKVLYGDADHYPIE